MRYKIKAFTLVELIVGISISVTLMVSIGIFVSTGMQTILLGQKSLENTSDLNNFGNHIYKSFNYMNTGSLAVTSSGIIFKRDLEFDNGGFTYIGQAGSELIDGDGIFCNSGSESPITNHAFIKSFIPFEEQGENIFNNYDKILTSTGITLNLTTYTSYQKEHVIKDSSGNIVIGKGVFGDKFSEGDESTDIYLNHPTGIATDGDVLYFSDTLNDRVLYMSGSQIYTLLDKNDGLKEPTGLYYDDSEKALYISNSGKGEILKFSSENITSNPEIIMNGFSESVNKIELEFFKNGTEQDINGYEISDFTITSHSANPDYLTGSTNKLEYYFINKNSQSIQVLCTGNEIFYSDGKPSIYCTNSGSGQTASYGNNTVSEIKINNLDNLNTSGNYHVKLKLFDESNQKYSGIFPFFTQGDGKIYTKGDNILETHLSGLEYPTGIWGVNDYNEFKISDITDTNNLTFDKNNDLILTTPIDKLEKVINNTDNIALLKLLYYSNYSCYDLDQNTQKIRTFIANKNLK